MRIAWTLLLLSSVASAENRISDDAWYPRVSAGAGIGYRSGDLSILHVNAASLGAQLAVKLRPALFVDASYDFAHGTGRDEDMIVDDVVLTTHTLGIAVRNPLMSFGDKPREFGGDMFVTAGLSREWIRWSGGGMARNALMLGTGTTIIVPSERTHRQVRVGLRMLFARAPEPGKRTPGCDGPCDTPTKTQPYDLSMLLEVSCHIGH